MNALITATELLEIRSDANVIIIEVGKKEIYQENHLKNAIFLDLDTDLAKIEDHLAVGGRHPLPKIEDFTLRLGEKGITPEHHLVVYDRSACAMGAARFWWMMLALGHQKIQVLNGGFASAEKKAFPISTETTKLETSIAYPNKNQTWQLKHLDLNEVKKGIAENKILLVDVRSSERYNGISEPIDLVAGHIPTAINLPFTEHLNHENEYISSVELAEKYQFLQNQEKEVVVYCGSGVSACHLLLAMEVAQLKIPAIYMGSWSEWSRNEI